ncbi:hypothetical protein HNP86_001769 [Methanococcus maripaludis]|uniref:Uncharacterized protein n=1 Tax=Methanococcus maripaludis TaxID=39152 RepID=A0A7J9NVB2_METMI|nr:hypothetical protein [Methanococcus maripaludis]MBA2851610.1 hypothetical protein [Methanococcus maripaludis]
MKTFTSIGKTMDMVVDGAVDAAKYVVECISPKKKPIVQDPYYYNLIIDKSSYIKIGFREFYKEHVYDPEFMFYGDYVHDRGTLDNPPAYDGYIIVDEAKLLEAIEFFRRESYIKHIKREINKYNLLPDILAEAEQTIKDTKREINSLLSDRDGERSLAAIPLYNYMKDVSERDYEERLVDLKSKLTCAESDAEKFKKHLETRDDMLRLLSRKLDLVKLGKYDDYPEAVVQRVYCYGPTDN